MRCATRCGASRVSNQVILCISLGVREPVADTPDEIIKASPMQIPIDGDLHADRVRVLMARDHLWMQAIG